MLGDDSSDSKGSSVAIPTRELTLTTDSAKDALIGLEPASSAELPARRDFAVRLGELIILFAAIIGAVALGLGISAYLGAHPYVFAYLAAYAAFRLADLLVRDEHMLGIDKVRLSKRVMYELPLLALFFGAPFERTFVYGGEAPRWLAGLGLLIELAGIWLALGARIQFGFFSSRSSDPQHQLIESGLYRYIRHPIYAGESLVWLAWPFEYVAPITLLLVIVIGLDFTRRRIRHEEAGMMAQYGDTYAAYMRATDRMIPNLW